MYTAKLLIKPVHILALLTLFLLLSSSMQIKVNHFGTDFIEGRYFIKNGNDSYLAVNNPVKDMSSSQQAFFGKQDYIQGSATRYSKELWIRKTGDGNNSFYIMSKFGETTSYLHINGLVLGGGYQTAYFAAGNYLANKTNYQNYFQAQPAKIHLYQGGLDLTLGADTNSSDWGWAYFYSKTYSSSKFDQLTFQKLDDNNYEQCLITDQPLGNSAAFYMTSDPQNGFGTPGNGGRGDGEANFPNTYQFLKSQVLSPGCPQSFIGIAGDLNFQSTSWQTAFYDKFANSVGNYQIVADILGNHDIQQLSKYSMIEKLETQFKENLFYWRDAVRANPSFVKRSTTNFTDYQRTVYSRINATFYTLELRSKFYPASLVAYVIMTHNQLRKNAWYLNYVSSQPDFNQTVPIILVTHAVNGQSNDVSDWIQKHRVAVILSGHVFCGDAYHDDHCDRRSNTTNIIKQIQFGNKKINDINTSGVRDRVFWSIGLNNTHLFATRKAWTNRV